MTDPLADASWQPRKRPSQDRSAKTFDDILAAARKVWTEQGPRGYTTNEIARTAGISIGSLYQYFPNKDAITWTLVEIETDALVTDLAGRHAHAAGRAGIRHLVLAFATHRARLRVLETMANAGAARARGSADSRCEGPVRSMIRNVLDNDDRLQVNEAEVVARDIVAIVAGIVDAANDAGEADPSFLGRRIECAVFGYLNACQYALR
ncbi:TetR/AcrR family transcriptional regulator [Burkholderia sp. Ac-20384]|uniref:Nucleoid occlusion factor SlmA n=1 Tax=Burkholderia lata (strain ATCC 17760 / DSM 23089 / LMG 22485 / NCIMB 9086 / R18194 / 383) TaxID=482957 RepID=A0A833PP25_BURL3|nr:MULTISPECIES: TetR/AcrR family transcriptional regulator [Burkholderia]KAF1035332.1 MAG: Nucleoid occlusion factor SlmA [Burkholderia lata]MBN3823320.1 TetR/AcrR family transcriptional regulator [Burkholderia sp. Ac-20384]